MSRARFSAGDLPDGQEAGGGGMSPFFRLPQDRARRGPKALGAAPARRPFHPVQFRTIKKPGDGKRFPSPGFFRCRTIRFYGRDPIRKPKAFLPPAGRNAAFKSQSGFFADSLFPGRRPGRGPGHPIRSCSKSPDRAETANSSAVMCRHSLRSRSVRKSTSRPSPAPDESPAIAAPKLSVPCA